MRLFGVDFSSGRADPQQLAREGVCFVCRYVSTPGNPKNLTRAEASGYRAAGIQVVTVFESAAGRARAGRAAGVVDARSAAAQVFACGAPADAPIYFAVDFNATTGDQAAIDAYLAGAVSVLGHDRVGIYGGFGPVSRALAAGVCKYGWQTAAWSGGRWAAGAQLRQYRNGVKLGGLSVDFDSALATDYGQWHPPIPRPAPVVFPADESFWTWVRWRTGTGEFADYGTRNTNVRPNVPARIPAAWWRSLRRFAAARPE